MGFEQLASDQGFAAYARGLPSQPNVLGDPQLENDSGPAAIRPWASRVLMKTGILQITPKAYII